MRMLKSLIVGLLVATAIGQAQTKSVRIGHHIVSDLDDIDDSFLRYLSQMGYTHVLAHADMEGSSAASEWSSGDYLWGGPRILHAKFRNLFVRANARNLKVIPCFNFGSSHSSHWWVTNSSIQWNSYTENSGVTYRSTVFTPEPDGIDKSFNSFLDVVKRANQDAGLGGTLDYIHIGHDEVARGEDLMIARDNSDERNFIAGNGDDSTAYHKLMAQEMVRRVNAVQARLPGTKTIFWADFWDKGNYPFKFKAYSTRGDIWFNTHHVAARPELGPIKSLVVPMLWRNKERLLLANGQRGPVYNTDAAIKHLADNGFNQILVSAAYEPYEVSIAEGQTMVRKWAQSGQVSYASKVLGYCTHSWWDGGPLGPGARWKTDPNNAIFRVLPEMAMRAGFYRQRNDILHLWDNNGRLSVETYASDGSRFHYLSGGHTLGGMTGDFLTGDINQDDRTDLFQVWNDAGTQRVEVYTSDGTRLNYASGGNAMGSPLGHVKLFTGDVNGDFRTDIIHVRQASGKLTAYAYAANGTGFYSLSSSPVGPINNTLLAYFAEDYNGDGLTDFISVRQHPTYPTSQLLICGYPSDGTRFGTETCSSADANLPTAGQYVIADLNGDRRADILHAWNLNNSLAVETYTSRGTSYARANSTASLGPYSANFFIGDMDADGRSDIIKLRSSNGSLTVDTYKYTTSFSQASSGYTLGNYSALQYRIGDINRDGRADIFKFVDNAGRLGIETFASDGTRFNPLSNGYTVGGAVWVRFLVGDIDGNRN